MLLNVKIEIYKAKRFYITKVYSKLVLLDSAHYTILLAKLPVLYRTVQHKNKPTLSVWDTMPRLTPISWHIIHFPPFTSYPKNSSMPLRYLLLSSSQAAPSRHSPPSVFNKILARHFSFKLLPFHLKAMPSHLIFPSFKKRF